MKLHSHTLQPSTSSLLETSLLRNRGRPLLIFSAYHASMRRIIVPIDNSRESVLHTLKISAQCGEPKICTRNMIYSCGLYAVLDKSDVQFKRRRLSCCSFPLLVPSRDRCLRCLLSRSPFPLGVDVPGLRTELLVRRLAAVPSPLANIADEATKLAGFWLRLLRKHRLRLLEGLPESEITTALSESGDGRNCENLIRDLVLAPVAWCFKVRVISSSWFSSLTH